MSEWAGTAAILLSLHEAKKGAFHRLRESLPEAITATGPDVHVFEGFAGTGGAGADVQVLATRSDGRLLSWLVEIWIDWRPDDGWYATVKGEIDLDDDEGREHCILNEQRSVASGEQAAAAIRELAALVADYPLDELLAARSPPEPDDASGAQPGAVITRTVIQAPKNPDDRSSSRRFTTGRATDVKINRPVLLRRGHVHLPVGCRPWQGTQLRGNATVISRA